jgi:HPt (histidine-containing phosphotransfer) domain-containing protein
MKEQGEFSIQDSGTQMFSSTLLDLAQSLKQTGGDAELLRELCCVLVADVPHYLESAAAALHSADLVGVQRHVRSLRAACATVGASQVTAVAVLLEAHCRVDDICGARLKFAQLSELVSILTSELNEWVSPNSRTFPGCGHDCVASSGQLSYPESNNVISRS